VRERTDFFEISFLKINQIMRKFFMEKYRKIKDNKRETDTFPLS